MALAGAGAGMALKAQVEKRIEVAGVMTIVLGGGERAVDVPAEGVGCRVDVDRHQGPEG